MWLGLGLGGRSIKQIFLFMINDQDVIGIMSNEVRPTTHIYFESVSTRGMHEQVYIATRLSVFKNRAKNSIFPDKRMELQA